MGLIKAGIGALGGVLADQWKEFFYCEALDMDTLVVQVRSVCPVAAPTPRAATTLSATAPASPWPTVSV